MKCLIYLFFQQTEQNKVSTLETDEPPKKMMKVSQEQIIEKFVNVPVSRTAEIIESRSKLPIIGEEDIVIDAIRNNDVVIIAGETGSGKTTQVPQFLYEAGFTGYFIGRYLSV